MITSLEEFMKLFYKVFLFLLIFVSSSFSSHITNAEENAQEPWMLTGAWVDSDVRSGNKGYVVVLNLYNDYNDGKKLKLELTETASVPQVLNQAVIVDGKFREMFGGLEYAWVWEDSKLIRYERYNGGKIEKGKEFYTQREGDRTVLISKAYVFPDNPNIFKYYPAWGYYASKDSK